MAEGGQPEGFAVIDGDAEAFDVAGEELADGAGVVGVGQHSGSGAVPRTTGTPIS